MPILNPEKPRRISLTMANTLFGTMSGVRPVNWGLLIHKVVARAIPNIGRKPSYLSPFLLHLYRWYECITADKEDLLAIAADEVTYKVRQVAPDSNTSSDPAQSGSATVLTRKSATQVSHISGSEFPESCLSPTSPSGNPSGSRTKPCLPLAECGPLLLGVSGNSFQASL
jgi:hypothetical protein